MSPDAGSIPAASTILMPREKLKDGRTLRPPRWLSFSLVFLSAFALAEAQSTLRVQSQDYENYSRVIVTLPAALPATLLKDDTFLQVRIPTGATFRLKADPVKSRFIKSFSWNKVPGTYILIIEGRHGRFRYDSFQIEKRRQLVIDFYEQAEPTAPVNQEPGLRPVSERSKTAPKKEEPPPATTAAAPPPPSQPAPGPARSGVRTIVIDPGHGGIEVGAKGKFGALEKDVTLAISLKLKSLIEKNLAYMVELTRDKDIDVPLETRAAIANNHKAELFISVHVNGSNRRNAKGSETFFLSLNATDEESRRLAYLENSQAQFEKPMDTANKDEIMMILWDMAQSAYLKESQRLAEIIQEELNTLLGTANRGIKQAPFKVLTGVACPAVLVEVAFISNPEEEKELVDERFQENVAQAIYRGLLSYIKLTT
jgi:N-acetylmuramoyl-L-alanine amidase